VEAMLHLGHLMSEPCVQERVVHICQVREHAHVPELKGGGTELGDILATDAKVWP